MPILCPCYAHGMPLWCSCYVPFYGHGVDMVLLPYKIKKNGCRSKKGRFILRRKGGIQKQCRGKSPPAWQFGIQRKSRTGRAVTKSCCVSDFLAFFKKNFLYHLSSNTSFILLSILSDFLAFLQKNFLHIHVYSPYIKSIVLNTFS